MAWNKVENTIQEYSPRKVFNTYGNFMKVHVSYNWRLFMLVSLGSFFGYLFIVMTSVISKSGSRPWFEGIPFFLSIVLSGIIISSLSILLMLILGKFVWWFKFQINGKEIIDYFPSRRVYSINEISQINLISPITANIVLKKDGDVLNRSVNWYGTSEDEWISFLNLIVRDLPVVKDRIYVRNSLWNPGLVEKTTVELSYKKIMDLYRFRK